LNIGCSGLGTTHSRWVPKNRSMIEKYLSLSAQRANMNAPDTKEAFTDIARFFDRHLGK